MEETLSKGKKRKGKSSEAANTKQSKSEKVLTFFTDLGEINMNQYVVVAYQGNWYPGFVETLTNENEVQTNFMIPCKQKGYYQWPLRPDKQL